MSHFTAFLKLAKSLQKTKDKAQEKSILDKLDDVTERDMAKQRMNIRMKLEQKKPLTEFEKWFIQQPEYYAGN